MENVNKKEEKNKDIEIKNEENEIIETNTKVEQKEIIKEVRNEIIKEIEENKVEVENIKEKSTEDKQTVNFEIQKQQAKQKRRKRISLFILITLLFTIILIGSTIFAFMNMNHEKIVSGVSILGIDVSGLTMEEAKSRLVKHIENSISGIELSYNAEEKKNEQENFALILTPEDLETKFDINKAVEKAYKIGRESNIVVNNFAILKANIFKTDIELDINLNEEKMNSIIETIASKLPGAVTQSIYHIENDKLIIVKGKSGITVKKQELEELIHNSIIEQIKGNRQQEFQVPVEQVQPDKLDINKIHEEIYKEAQNAYFTTNPYKVYAHVDGVDFAISIQEIEEILNEEKEQYEIPLKIVSPNITTDKLGKEAFPDLLASYSTTFDSSNVNRTKNIQIAAKKISEKIILPGEEFSYNTVVGPRTAQAGFKPAAIYLNGEVAQGIGGGICQLSSTLYNAALYANLEITERSNHHFLTGYVPASRDATVSYGTLDFKFKNTRTNPIKIIATGNNGVCKVEIYGIKEEVEYDIEIQSYVIKSIPYTIKYVNNSQIEQGQEKVIEKGSNGCKSVAYRVVKQNGVIISKTQLSSDTYSAHQRVVQIGTKQVTPIIAPETKVEVPVDAPVVENIVTNEAA